MLSLLKVETYTFKMSVYEFDEILTDADRRILFEVANTNMQDTYVTGTTNMIRQKFLLHNACSPSITLRAKKNSSRQKNKPSFTGYGLCANENCPIKYK